MDVFLVPTAEKDYELYTEEVEEEEIEVKEPEAPASGVFARAKFRVFGFFARMKLRFTQMLAEAERERLRGHAENIEQGGWISRITRKVMRWVAESIAEQRLLWNLRRAERATFYYPSDIPEADAVAELRRQLNRDFEKHRFWLAIDSVLMVASGLLVLVPGPNILGYYFAFRVVGHFFSVRGARRGLNGVEWTHEAREPLARLRGVGAMDPVAGLEQIQSIASELRLDHLPSFFQRVYSQR
jgi:Mitochondrial K+-H+ exchange-related